MDHTVFFCVWLILLGILSLDSSKSCHMTLFLFLRLSSNSVVYMYFVYPFVHTWAFVLLPPLGHFKQCYYEQRHINTSSIGSVLFVIYFPQFQLSIVNHSLKMSKKNSEKPKKPKTTTNKTKH